MSTSLHSEKSLLLQTQVTVARAHAMAVQKLPVALTLSAIILSIINVWLEPQRARGAVATPTRPAAGR
jgi:hypothetical protein